MNKCTESDIQEMLPDLLHRTLAADESGRVEAHLATCEECREDLEVLRAVKSAAVFAPTIDVDRVVRQIPPYRTIVPAKHPASTRVVSWLVAASLAVVVIGGGSLIVMRQNVTKAPAAVATTQPAVRIPTQPIPVNSGTSEPVTSPETVVTSVQPHTHALALAANVDDLSDGNLVQLMNEMNRFDALPASEPDPMISVDTAYNLEQNLR
ncbi:MAG: zf-HC2 domain-containing protein [Gemmatimonadota bacterium]|nr:zf-HC2 domain-containing protein [Gemmatimonadota bacterium]